ncbi:gamma-interferon-inducible lysosomal thiol reductase-like isoform X4 [Narcine bancroftii]|uniref:gamma-interferon-inducible lysosomal thiol reductase-like isoform X4 n=1 Tax=Narcine bancroftii TaxID=1343680 RepID=UPI0038316A50
MRVEAVLSCVLLWGLGEVVGGPVCRYPPTQWCSTYQIASACQERNESGKWIFNCQHGQEECTGNMIEACLMHTLQNVKRFFPIIFCMESAPDVISAAQLCLKVYEPTVDWTEIEKCVNGNLGNKLMHQNAERTEALNPPHKYVPWILVNGVHSKELQTQAMTSLFNLVCNTYKGKKPPVCGLSEGRSPFPDA